MVSNNLTNGLISQIPRLACVRVAPLRVSPTPCLLPGQSCTGATAMETNKGRGSLGAASTDAFEGLTVVQALAEADAARSAGNARFRAASAAGSTDRQRSYTAAAAHYQRGIAALLVHVSAASSAADPQQAAQEQYDVLLANLAESWLRCGEYTEALTTLREATLRMASLGTASTAGNAPRKPQQWQDKIARRLERAEHGQKLMAGEVGKTMQNTGFPLNWFVAGPGNETPEHTWGWRTHLETAVRSGVETEVWALTSGKEFADLKQFVECAKLLHHAVEGGHLAVAQLLVQEGWAHPEGDISAHDKHGHWEKIRKSRGYGGSTPLAYAVMKGHEACARWLLEAPHSCNPMTPNNHGVYPLFYAVMTGSDDKARALRLVDAMLTRNPSADPRQLVPGDGTSAISMAQMQAQETLDGNNNSLNEEQQQSTDDPVVAALEHRVFALQQRKQQQLHDSADGGCAPRAAPAPAAAQSEEVAKLFWAARVAKEKGTALFRSKRYGEADQQYEIALGFVEQNGKLLADAMLFSAPGGDLEAAAGMMEEDEAEAEILAGDDQVSELRELELTLLSNKAECCLRYTAARAMGRGGAVQYCTHACAVAALVSSEGALRLDPSHAKSLNRRGRAVVALSLALQRQAEVAAHLLPLETMGGAPPKPVGVEACHHAVELAEKYGENVLLARALAQQVLAFWTDYGALNGECVKCAQALLKKAKDMLVLCTAEQQRTTATAATARQMHPFGAAAFMDCDFSPETLQLMAAARPVAVPPSSAQPGTFAVGSAGSYCAWWQRAEAAASFVLGRCAAAAACAPGWELALEAASGTATGGELAGVGIAEHKAAKSAAQASEAHTHFEEALGMYSALMKLPATMAMTFSATSGADPADALGHTQQTPPSPRICSTSSTQKNHLLLLPTAGVLDAQQSFLVQAELAALHCQQGAWDRACADGRALCLRAIQEPAIFERGPAVPAEQAHGWWVEVMMAVVQELERGGANGWPQALPVAREILEAALRHGLRQDEPMTRAAATLRPLRRLVMHCRTVAQATTGSGFPVVGGAGAWVPAERAAVEYQRALLEGLRTSGRSSSDACAICLEPLDPEDKNLQIMECYHVFHDDCIGQVVQKMARPRGFQESPGGAQLQSGGGARQSAALGGGEGGAELMLMVDCPQCRRPLMCGRRPEAAQIIHSS